MSNAGNLATEPAVLVLEDGRAMHGRSFGAVGTTFGEAVCSTGMTGYQETLTDPSYHRQVVVMTAPHVGKTGMNDEDPESGRIWVSAAYAGGLPTRGSAFVSLANRDKRASVFPIKRLAGLGFGIFATQGTAEILRRNGVPVDVLRKQHEGRGKDGTPTAVDAIMAGHIDPIVNTPYGVGPCVDGYEIRTAAVTKGIPCVTAVQGLSAAVQGIDALVSGEPNVRSLQEHGAHLAHLREQSRAQSQQEGEI